ncbi:MAG TPA: glycosyltransferase [Thermoleophilia bacterium]|nr:glycosyltransferase [Thermoleophilia bacterium]
MRTPIVLFVFNRPSKASRVISALRDQTVRPKELIVFADGARVPADQPRVNAVRDLVRSIEWTGTRLIERERNFGCAQNIIEGLTEVFSSYERAVIVEDDVLPAASFYESLCVMLDRYASSPGVFSVGGFPSVKADALPGYPFDVIMSPRFSCWGWGTWADRWRGLASDLPSFRNPFGSPDDVPLHAGRDLRDGARAVERRPSFYWDFPLTLLCLHRGLLHALTRYYLVSNIGTDSGTHGNVSSAVLKFLEENNVICNSVPRSLPPVSLQAEVVSAVQQYVRQIGDAAVVPSTTALSPMRVLKHLGARLRRR